MARSATSSCSCRSTASHMYFDKLNYRGYNDVSPAAAADLMRVGRTA